MLRNYPLPAVSSRPGIRGQQRARLLAAGGLVGLMALPGAAVRGEDLFASQPLDQVRFAILGRPVGQSDWNLLVLEQLAASPRCWDSRPDGLVDPSLNRFNFTGICSRYIDSNGYSVRIGEQDLASTYRLKLVQVGSELRLLASTVDTPADLLVGRGRVPLRDRDGFVQLSLEPGWSLQRRTYEGRGLSHLYLANSDSLPALLARLQPASMPGSRGSVARNDRGPSTLMSRLGSLGSTPEAPRLPVGAVADRGPRLLPGQPVPLQVIPFRE